MVTKSVARRHHYVPQAYLAAFTSTGEKDGQFYVLDVETGRAFRTSPLNVGAQRDFNRVEVDGHPPDAIESALAPFEGSAVAAIRRVIDSEAFPNDSDWKAHSLMGATLLLTKLTLSLRVVSRYSVMEYITRCAARSLLTRVTMSSPCRARQASRPVPSPVTNSPQGMFVYGLSITCKTVSPPLQLLVELGQQDVCQQWREWPTLWCAHFAGFNVLSNQHPGAQVAPIKRSSRLSAMERAGNFSSMSWLLVTQTQHQVATSPRLLPAGPR